METRPTVRHSQTGLQVNYLNTIVILIFTEYLWQHSASRIFLFLLISTLVFPFINQCLNVLKPVIDRSPWERIHLIVGLALILRRYGAFFLSSETVITSRHGISVLCGFSAVLDFIVRG